MEALAFDRGPHLGKRSKVRALVHAVRNIIPAAPEPPSILDPLQALRMEALRALAEHVHSRLATASDLDELGSAVEDLLWDEEYARLRDRLVEFFSVEGGLDILIDPMSAPRPDYLLRLVSDDPALVALVERGHDLQMAYLKAGLQWVTHLQKNSTRLENHEAPKSALWFLDDPRIPLELKKVWLAREKADVCQDGLFATAHRGGLPRWAVEYLLRGWVDGIHAYLTFLCGQPGVDPPEGRLVRRDEILDTRRLFVLHAASELGYQERLKAARRSGDWYPMPEPEDGG